MVKLPEKKAVEIFPAGEYLMAFNDIRTESDQGVPYEIDGKQRALWIFDVVEALDDDAECEAKVGSQYTFFTSFLLTPRSKMNEYLEAILGREIEMGETPDDEELDGKRVRVFVEHYTKTMGPNAGQLGDRPGKMVTHKPKKRRAPVDVEEDDDDAPEPVAVGVSSEKKPGEPF